jgi:uncharacterized protein YecE (DUF72 family)
MIRWYLGTIGFSYKDWVGSFYPVGTVPRNYLSLYSKVFNSVEIDTSFHAVPRNENIISWAATVPPDFKVCFKTPRRITHELQLINADSLMDEFITAIKPLGDKIVPILIQMPPRFTQANISTLEMFLDKLPQFYRYAIEFRHSSWYIEKTSKLLSKYRVCWVSIDFPRIPKAITPTTDFLYIRWIGINGMYGKHTHERADKSDQLRWWLNEIRSKEDNITEFYGFFNNDYTGCAASTCVRFKKIAGFSSDTDVIPLQERFL